MLAEETSYIVHIATVDHPQTVFPAVLANLAESVCVCVGGVCVWEVCVCGRCERERKGERERMCTCVCVSVPYVYKCM